jgi:predicted glycogen debranching enzyme
MVIDDRTEWLETDGLGGFASGTTSGVRSRRYHALLLTATTPPTGRSVLVNGFDAWLDTPSGPVALTTQRYAPGVDHPDGATRIVSFSHVPWPTWEIDTTTGVRLRQELCVEHGTGAVVLVWTLVDADAPVALHVRPFVSGRDYHSMHHENGAFRFDAERAGRRVVFRPYDGVPAIVIESTGDYCHAPDWYRNFLYSAEAERGLDATEDLAAPGIFSWPLASNGHRAALILEAGLGPLQPVPPSADVVADRARSILSGERARRLAFRTPLERAADAYFVRRGSGLTIVAGYPWFTDWGRDTFIAVRGLCGDARRLETMRDILLEWSGAVSEGMLPNRFPDQGGTPEFNSVDASLWYVVAVGQLVERARATRARVLDKNARLQLEGAVLHIVEGYRAGTRFGIHVDEEDGLLAAGVPGQQLTWMDAKIGDWVVTPRIGKPVEVQALWLNALEIAARFDTRWQSVIEQVRRSFLDRFWIESAGHLADVVDVDHVKGAVDGTFRPNQILAVGGLPTALVEGDKARWIVDAVEERLLTPLGLRSLSPLATGYVPRYAGGPAQRDSAYHQGTVWPWLMGPFVDAWLRVRGDSARARQEARTRFLDPLIAHLETAGLGHVSEIADGESPFTPRGCPFQAWSVGELIRIAAQLAPRRVPSRGRDLKPELRRGHLVTR